MRYPLEKPLEMARRHVAEAEARVARQRELVAELERQGRDATQVQAVLDLFEDTLRLMHEGLADRLKEAGQPHLDAKAQSPCAGGCVEAAGPRIPDRLALTWPSSARCCPRLAVNCMR